MVTSHPNATIHTNTASIITNASKAFATIWTEPEPAGYTLKINNAATSANVFNIKAYKFSVPDFFHNQ